MKINFFIKAVGKKKGMGEKKWINQSLINARQLA